jgi:DNA-binding winged helix-turn-helix (wHTH) protein
MAHGFSKENQSSPATAYRFGDFELNPRDRLLRRASIAVPLQPRAFDALLCLLRNAEHLVSKQQLISLLWPSTHVSETNLTNLIVDLRKLVGRDAIRTVSKHGYRFELPVVGEPGVPRSTYERFARAKELAAQRSLESMYLARDLYWTCLAEDPTFAPAWAWLGRCCWFLDKFSGASSANLELAQAAFQRAFALDQDLASAHQFFTFLQVDTGHADLAMCRLLKRLQHYPREPESFSSLVQVLRFRGLLQQSLEAHKQAKELDPAIVTSVAHTLFLAGEYASAIEAYSGRAAYYLDAAAWAALGDRSRAIAVLSERLDRMTLSKLMTALMSSLLAVLEGKAEDAVRLMETADTTRDPEVKVYFARHYAQIGLIDSAIHALEQAAQLGFVCAPATLTSDAWLSTLGRHREFGSLLNRVGTLIEEAKSSFERSPSSP